jgi:hypothetical protein
MVPRPDGCGTNEGDTRVLFDDIAREKRKRERKPLLDGGLATQYARRKRLQRVGSRTGSEM